MHKVQSQTLRFVGVDLRDDIFVHGHMYLALSRVRCSKNLLLLLPDDRVRGPVILLRNVVWQELLLRPEAVEEVRVDDLIPADTIVAPNPFNKPGCLDVSVEEVEKLVREQHFWDLQSPYRDVSQAFANVLKSYDKIPLLSSSILHTP